MTEKELQNYLYDNPGIIFPGKIITEKTKEYYIKGKRIDLLFVVDNKRYIVELKAVPLKREHIGQIVEYYGLMKKYFYDTNLRMIIVSPSIPSWKSVLLEEIGIQCIEFDLSGPVSSPQFNESKLISERRKIDSIFTHVEELTEKSKYEKSVANATGPPSRHDVGLIRKTMQDILPAIANAFEDFEPHPFGITKAWSNDFDYECIPGKYGIDMYTRGKVWFAFRFGEGKNDIPNISVIFHNAGCDVTINSEVQRSQKIVIEKVKNHGFLIDEAIAIHGGLQIKLYLKMQHHPFGYHWILMNFSKIKSKEIIKLYENIFANYPKMKEIWISHIKKYNPVLSYKERLYLDNHNKNVNIALRFADPITLDDDFWNKSFNEQNTIILDKIIKLKNLLYILCK